MLPTNWLERLLGVHCPGDVAQSFRKRHDIHNYISTQIRVSNAGRGACLLDTLSRGTSARIVLY